MRKLLTSIGVVFLAIFAVWVVANAGIGMKAPDITSEIWLNSTPLHLSDLKGKVVMVEFWTFGCYNCQPCRRAGHRTHPTHSSISVVSGETERCSNGIQQAFNLGCNSSSGPSLTLSLLSLLCTQANQLPLPILS